MDVLLGGIEGGATHSKLVLFNGKGEKLCQVAGPGTNHWMLGMSECQLRIKNMVEEAKKEANVPIDSPLTALGMSLSGCEQEETNNKLKDGLQEKYPTLSQNYVVCSDTVGSIAAAHETGGMVLIAGTGSNCLLLNPDGSLHRCGGWGHILGDEGSAWWISHKAIKTFFDDGDNYIKAPYDTGYVWKAIQEHFKISNREDILRHYYTEFDKSYFAGLCKRLAEGAKEGDELCRWLFKEAGRALAGFVRALARHTPQCSCPGAGGSPVVCVGSVWLSWEFLKPGFIERLREPPKDNETIVDELQLMKLTTSMAVGATYLAAKSINFDLPRDYSKNFEVFFHYKRSDINGF